MTAASLDDDVVEGGRSDLSLYEYVLLIVPTLVASLTSLMRSQEKMMMTRIWRAITNAITSLGLTIIVEGA